MRCSLGLTVFLDAINYRLKKNYKAEEFTLEQSAINNGSNITVIRKTTQIQMSPEAQACNKYLIKFEQFNTLKLCVILTENKQTLRKKCSYLELFWSVFSRIRTEYGKIRSISPYLVLVLENTDSNNSEYGHFSRSESLKFPVKQGINLFPLKLNAVFKILS